MFQNSNEFTQLGTLTKENRVIDYYPPDQPSLSKPSARSIDLINDGGRQQVYPVGERLREQHYDVVKDNMNMILEKK